MFRWYVINTYSGHENKVRQNLLHRVESMSQQDKIRRVVVPTEKAVETKDGQKIEVEKRVLPGYVLVQMEMTDDSWHVVKNTPGVTGFVGGVGHGAERQRPTALSELEVNRLLHTATTDAAKPQDPRRVLARRDGQGHLGRARPTSRARSPRSTPRPDGSRCRSRSSSGRCRSSSRSRTSRRSTELAQEHPRGSPSRDACTTFP